MNASNVVIANGEVLILIALFFLGGGLLLSLLLLCEDACHLVVVQNSLVVISLYHDCVGDIYCLNQLVCGSVKHGHFLATFLILIIVQYLDNMIHIKLHLGHH